MVELIMGLVGIGLDLALDVAGFILGFFPNSELPQFLLDIASFVLGFIF